MTTQLDSVRAELLRLCEQWVPRNAHPVGLARLLAVMVQHQHQTVRHLMLRAFGRYACRPLRRAGGRFTPKQYATAIAASLIGLLAHTAPTMTLAEIAAALDLTSAGAVTRTLHLADRNARRVVKGLPKAARTLPYLRLHGDRAPMWFLRPLLKRERASFWTTDLRTRTRRTTT